MLKKLLFAAIVFCSPLAITGCAESPDAATPATTSSDTGSDDASSGDETAADGAEKKAASDSR